MLNRIRLACLASLLLFASCPTPAKAYFGPRLPSSETALLVGMSGWSPLNPAIVTKVTAVDGLDVEGGSRIEILPGERRLELYASHQGGSGYRTMTLELEAGMKYLIAMVLGDPDVLVTVVPDGKR